MEKVAGSPERILQIATGAWAAGVLGAALTHRFFTHIDEGARRPEDIAARAGVSPRGAQAVLDGLVGLGLLDVDDGEYTNPPEAAAYLVEGRPGYLGRFALLEGLDMRQWMALPEAVRTGRPVERDAGDREAFFAELVRAIAPLALPVAEAAAERLGIAKAGPLSILDVGGGAGVYSAVWLRASPEARSTQVDFPAVNRVARTLVGSFGVGDRFETVDGDFHEVDFGEARYDVAVYSHIAHGESPEGNRALFRKIHRALRPAGRILVADFVLTDERKGHPFALLFHANMFLRTEAGACWREADYRAWLGETGYEAVEVERLPGPVSLVLGLKP